jgi:hypothetical protein
MRTSDGLVEARRIAGAATAEARKLRRDSVVTASLYPSKNLMADAAFKTPRARMEEEAGPRGWRPWVEGQGPPRTAALL